MAVSLFAQTPNAAVESVLPRMVKIFGAGKGIRGLHGYCTGFTVSPEGHVVTVWSYVLDSDDLTVVLNDGRKFSAKVLGTEPQLDLAVLKIEDPDLLDLPYFDLKAGASVGPGTRVFGFSNMYKVATGDDPVSVMHGVVSAHTKLSGRRGVFSSNLTEPVYIVDAITNNPGAEGGVLTTRSGKIIGMIGKRLRNSQSNTWVNYALPIASMESIVAQIISGRYLSEGDKPPEADNPLRYRPLDFGLVMVPDVVFRTPAYVDVVFPGSEANLVGIQSNDLVLFVNDELVQSMRGFKQYLGRLESGDTLHLVVRRNDELVSVQLSVKKK